VTELEYVAPLGWGKVSNLCGQYSNLLWPDFVLRLRQLISSAYVD